MKKGKVIDINKKRGVIAVKLEDGEFSVIELLGGHDVKMNDIISGNLEFLGGEKVFNESQKEIMSVYIQNANCTKNSAKHFMK